MLDSFSMQVPLASPFRALATEVAGRYAELAGGSPDAAAALSSALGAAIERAAAGAGPAASVAMAFKPETYGVSVDVTCGSHRESVDVTIPVAKR